MAEKIMTLAQNEAMRTRSNAIGTEHVLLALLADGRNAAVEVLRELGVNLERARQEIEWKLPPTAGGPPPGKLPLSPQAQKVLEAAASSEPEQLLIALADSPGTAGDVLRKLGVTRKSILEVLDAGDR
jgi:ATP-dependent Clp protease ATP-binding subunit ClpC